MTGRSRHWLQSGVGLVAGVMLCGCSSLPILGGLVGGTATVTGTVSAPASQVASLVFAGGAGYRTQSLPVPEDTVASASVWVASYGTDGSARLGIKATSGPDGTFTLTGVPTDKVLVIWAQATDSTGKTLTVSGCLNASGPAVTRNLDAASTIVSAKAVRIDESHFDKMTQANFTTLEQDVASTIQIVQVPDLTQPVDASVFDELNLSASDQALLAQ